MSSESSSIGPYTTHWMTGLQEESERAGRLILFQKIQLLLDKGNLLSCYEEFIEVKNLLMKLDSQRISSDSISQTELIAIIQEIDSQYELLVQCKKNIVYPENFRELLTSQLEVIINNAYSIKERRNSLLMQIQSSCQEYNRKEFEVKSRASHHLKEIVPSEKNLNELFKLFFQIEEIWKINQCFAEKNVTLKYLFDQVSKENQTLDLVIHQILSIQSTRKEIMQIVNCFHFPYEPDVYKRICQLLGHEICSSTLPLDPRFDVLFSDYSSACRSLLQILPSDEGSCLSAHGEHQVMKVESAPYTVEEPLSEEEIQESIEDIQRSISNLEQEISECKERYEYVNKKLELLFNNYRISVAEIDRQLKELVHQTDFTEQKLVYLIFLSPNYSCTQKTLEKASEDVLKTGEHVLSFCRLKNQNIQNLQSEKQLLNDKLALGKFEEHRQKFEEIRKDAKAAVVAVREELRQDQIKQRLRAQQFNQDAVQKQSFENEYRQLIFKVPNFEIKKILLSIQKKLIVLGKFNEHDSQIIIQMYQKLLEEWEMSKNLVNFLEALKKIEESIY